LSNSIDLEEYQTGSEISSAESETDEIEASLKKKYLGKLRIRNPKY